MQKTDEVYDDSDAVIGEAEPDSTITVELPYRDTVEGVTDEDGNFEVTLPEDTILQPGDEITVVATDEVGNESDSTIVEVLPADGSDGSDDADAGTPGTGDEDDDSTDDLDESDETDSEEDADDTEAPVITPIPDGSAVENEPMEDIVIETNEPSDVIVDGLPDSVEYDPERGVIGGTPVVNDWAEGETEREFTVTITATDEAGNSSTISFDLVIERVLSGLGAAATGSDSDEASGLPQTGESEGFLTNLLGMTSAMMGAALLAWNKKTEQVKEKIK